VNFIASVSANVIGAATKARVRVRDEQVQVRFTDRTSTVNMPKTELLRDLGVKGAGRRLGLPSEIAEHLPEAGTAVKLVPAKYGWFNLAVAADAAEKAASISK
jgi:hypothetical protein